jgi:hypothetical protein
MLTFPHILLCDDYHKISFHIEHRYTFAAITHVTHARSTINILATSAAKITLFFLRLAESDNTVLGILQCSAVMVHGDWQINR